MGFILLKRLQTLERTNRLSLCLSSYYGTLLFTLERADIAKEVVFKLVYEFSFLCNFSLLSLILGFVTSETDLYEF
jgi:hypothetical protein